MSTLLKYLLVDVAIIIVSFGLFTALIPGRARHNIWEKYISAFSKFIIYIFIATIAINVITVLIVYALRSEHYLNIIAPAVQSVLVGFVAACVPRRGVEDNNQERAS
jgi:hypothetical protein